MVTQPGQIRANETQEAKQTMLTKDKDYQNKTRNTQTELKTRALNTTDGEMKTETRFTKRKALLDTEGGKI